ncbi:hypothetical protein JCM11251_004406 [Rhodosporidiobolus azoricus]
MQFQSYPDHTFRKRKSRSPSPGPACKRRAPSSYTPSIYANLAAPPFTRSVSVEALASGTPTSERSSPGLDWLHQTQQLQLDTPPVQEADRAHEVAGAREDVGMGSVGGESGEAVDDAMQDDPPAAPAPAAPFHPHSSSSFPSNQHQAHHMHPRPPAHPHHNPPHQHTYSHPALSSAGFAFADPTFIPVVPSLPSPIRAAPHDAPPLHNHLAGSPQPQTGSNGMTPSSSTSSLYHSMAYGQGLPHVHELAKERDPSMGGTATSGGRAGQGGWKLTMGYRQDCEKCRNREPGHYSHLVPPH